MNDWTTLDELREGAVFETRDGTRAVKSEYRLIRSGCASCSVAVNLHILQMATKR